MKTKEVGLGLLALVSVLSVAPGQEPGRPTDGKDDQAGLAKLVHGMIAGQLPRVYEHADGWGATVPAPGKLALPRLRTRVRVGGREELPHGMWKKLRAQLDDPQRDLTIRVRDLKQQPNGLYRLSLDVEARMHGELEMQQWQKGLLLFNVIGHADAVLGIAVECDVKVHLNPKQLLGNVKLEPKVVDLQLGLREFHLRKVALRRLGPILQGERAREAGKMFRGMVEGQIRDLGPRMKDQFNESLGRGLASGKGTVPAGVLLKALSGGLK
ncbi:MAG: hypothetical protein IT429_20125 [Gemmataceae bacterium]|nr:hypothetical protein [Gemmataceae bacterium]